jgi:hypothetical protein
LTKAPALGEYVYRKAVSHVPPIGKLESLDGLPRNPVVKTLRDDAIHAVQERQRGVELLVAEITCLSR